MDWTLVALVVASAACLSIGVLIAASADGRHGDGSRLEDYE